MVKLTFVALRDEVAFAVRLRALLKYALRGCRLRCKNLEDVPPWKGRRGAIARPKRSRTRQRATAN
jgi:hypothetical protein